jgi:ubiquinone/menaquinone biosynthesis C-methylase UbiE
MADTAIHFSDADGYERFMGRWSRAVAPQFLRWLTPARDARWLDVGCGTGILAEAVLDLCEPSNVVGIDPAAAQIEKAIRGLADRRAKFRQGDAADLPFPGGTFDVAVAALVLNFVAEPGRAAAEMRRVTCANGVVAGYVWEFSRDLSPSGPLRRAMRAAGIEVPAIPGTVHSSLEALEALFASTGLKHVKTRTIDVTLSYEDFDDFWVSQTPGYSPTTKIIERMTDSECRRLKRATQEMLGAGAQGRVEYSARANAVCGVVP